MQEDAELEGAVGGAAPPGGGNDLQGSVRNLLAAMRDLLNNVEVQPPEREDEHQEDEEDNEDDWVD